MFLLYQDKNLVAQDVFAEERGEEKPTYQRFQGGASIGGPIIHDKMTFFGSYEHNRQDRDKSVFYGGSPTLPAVDLSPTSARSRARSARTSASRSCRTSPGPARRWTSATACATRAS